MSIISMDIINNRTYSKTIRTLKYLWPQLTKINNFVTPETIEEYKEFLFCPSIKVKNMEGYLNPTKYSLLDSFIQTLYQLQEINCALSLNFLHKKIFQFIQNSIINKIENNPTSPDNELQELLDSLLASKHSFLFIRQLDGIELVDLTSLTVGECEVFYFNDQNADDLRMRYSLEKDSEIFYQGLDNQIDSLKGKICIRCITVGNFHYAEKVAHQHIECSISILRFIAAFLIRDRLDANIIKITLLSEACHTNEDCITLNADTNEFTISFIKTNKPLFNLKIGNALVSNLKDYYFFEDLISIAQSKNKTELDQSILTAIYWIGEAQQEYHSHSAFI